MRICFRSSASERNPLRKYWFLPLVVLCITVIHLPLLPSFFDPQEFISFLNPMASGESFGDYLVSSWSWETQGRLIGFFRPFLSVLFMLEYHLWGADPMGYRLVNILFHLTISLLAVPLGRRLGIRRFIWVAPLLIAVHPGTIQAVWQIVSRHDVLAVLFSMIALILTLDVLSGRYRGWKGVLPWTAVVLGLGCKELAMANLPALLMAGLLWPDRNPDRIALKVFYWSAIPVTLIYLAARFLIFGNIGGYGGYTPLSALPLRFYTIILQATGAFCQQNTLLRAALLLLLAVPIVSLAMNLKGSIRKSIVLAGFFFFYGFQSIIAEASPHYVYSLAVFLALIAAFCAEKGRSLFGTGPALMTAVLAIVAAILLRSSLYLSSELRNANMPRENVFRSLEALSGDISNLQRVHIVRSSVRTAEDDELKHAGLFLEFFDPEIDTELVFVSDTSAMEPGSHYLVWENGEILLKTY